MERTGSNRLVVCGALILCAALALGSTAFASDPSVPHPSIGLQIHGYNIRPLGAVPNNHWQILHSGRVYREGRNASDRVFYVPVPAGEYRILITAPGYHNFDKTVQVSRTSARVYGGMYKPSSSRDAYVPEADAPDGIVAIPEPVLPDINSDGYVDTSDLFAYLTRWFAGDPVGDTNRDGAVNFLDLSEFINLWLRMYSLNPGRIVLK